MLTQNLSEPFEKIFSQIMTKIEKKTLNPKFAQKIIFLGRIQECKLLF